MASNAPTTAPAPLPAASLLAAALNDAFILGLQRGRNLSDTRAQLLQAFSQAQLGRLLQAHAGDYRAAEPFPHCVIEDLLPEPVIHELSAELPEKYGNDKKGCTQAAQTATVTTKPLTPTHYCINLKGREERKSALLHETVMGPVTIMVFRALKSVEFTEFLTKLSGLERPLIADPEYEGSGAAFVAPRGKLGLHADFNIYPKFQLARRVNTFLYLNRNWPDAYGGHLELWNRNRTRCVQRLHPSWNRFVVFSTTDFSWHGHPQPLAAPADRMRRNLALYYYTQGRPTGECYRRDCKTERGTYFVKPQGCNDCQEPTCRAYQPGLTTKQLTPGQPLRPALHVTARSAKERLIELNELLRAELISQAEYDLKRSSIIEAI